MAQSLRALLRANVDRTIAAVLAVAGLVALFVGWLGVSRSGLVAEQNPYLVSGGMTGLALIAISCTVWLSADLQDEWRALRAIEERLDAVRATGESATANEAMPDPSSGAAQRR